MNHRNLASITATALLIPLAALAQTSGSTTGSSTQPTTSGSPSQSTMPRQTSPGSTQGSPYGTSTQSGSSPYGTGTQSGSSQYGTSGTSAGSGSMGSQSWGSAAGTTGSSAGIQRISDTDLEHHVTASNLIGMEVKDPTGKTIGEVKDIGLTAAISTESSDLYGSTGSTGSSAGATAGTGAGTSGSMGATGSMGTSGSSGSAGMTGSRTGNVAGTTGSTGASGSSTLDSTVSGILSQASVQVIVDVEDSDGFVAVPVSELRYDQTNEEITIQRSRDELQRIAEGQTTASARTAQ